MNKILYNSGKRLKSLETRLKPQNNTILYQITNRYGKVVFSANLPMYINKQRIF